MNSPLLPMFRGIPGVSIEPLACRRADLRITLDAPVRRLDPAARQRVDEFWARETGRNPRLFDGPVLSCVEADATAGVIRCRRASYRELICQPIVETGVLQVSVTGVSLVADAAGVDHVQLGRRGRQTRVYGGMWELAPSGGLDSPARAASEAPTEMTGDDAWAQLMVEVEEELTIPDALERIPASDPVCLCIDHVARSLDIVYPVRLGHGVFPAKWRQDQPPDWEYEEFRSIPVEEIREFDARHGAEIIAPSRALLRFFGWV